MKLLNYLLFSSLNFALLNNKCKCRYTCVLWLLCKMIIAKTLDKLLCKTKDEISGERETRQKNKNEWHLANQSAGCAKQFSWRTIRKSAAASWSLRGSEPQSGLGKECGCVCVCVCVWSSPRACRDKLGVWKMFTQKKKKINQIGELDIENWNLPLALTLAYTLHSIKKS